MGELLLETVLDITFGVIEFLFILPGELAMAKAVEWGLPISWLKGSLAFLISLCFWSIVALLIYFFTVAF